MSDVSYIIDYSAEPGLALPGYGRVYQGSGPNIGMHEFPEVRDRMLVQMAADIGSLQCRAMKSVVFMGIDDGPTGVLPDAMLAAMVALQCAWLRQGGDLVIGCLVGVSRSSYMNIAVMMRLTGWPFERCLARVRVGRPQANPMQCFVEQLQRQ